MRSALGSLESVSRRMSRIELLASLLWELGCFVSDPIVLELGTSTAWQLGLFQATSQGTAHATLNSSVSLSLSDIAIRKALDETATLGRCDQGL